MRISLYLVDKIVDFMLPNQVSGSFSFDESGNNLINVEARNDSWFLYSTSDVQVVHNGVFVDSVVLEDGFYTLKRDNKSFLIFAKKIVIPNMQYYSYDNSFRCIIGNTSSCTFIYDSIYLNDLMVGVAFNNGRLVLEKRGDTVIYVNKKAVVDNPFNINYGDCLDIYGLRIVFLNGVVAVSNLDNLRVDANGAFLRTFDFPIASGLIDTEIKDLDLYSKGDYASKAPRLRRIIESKKISFSAPPSSQEETEMPLILVIGPMFTMGIVSLSMIFSVVSRVMSGSPIKDNIVQIITGVAMLASTIVWPLVTKKYNEKMKKKKKKELVDKYDAYLKDKEVELSKELNLQKTILIENLINVGDCLNNIKSRNISFWSKRIDQNDFLVARIGIGNELLNAEISLSEDEFTIEDNDLKKQADDLKNKYKYIENVPIGYSFYDNFITAIMGTSKKTFGFINNILLQFLSFYSYEDLKIVVFTEGNHSNWDYIKYLNHNFNDDKSFRFFGSTQDSIKSVADYLNFEVNNRVNGSDKKPYYLIIVDDYDKIKRYDFVETLTESDNNLGFSFIIVEDKLSRLPSKCDNFITLNENQSGVLKNSYEKQEQIVFYDEINYDIDMMNVAKILSNIPVEFENDIKGLPNSISFLEMEGVGKVEQLNILNRWNTNDSTSSLKCEIGVDENGSLMYLDLHEKFHGPHGLIAGMTGSGKSEFIITYILSMSINYSPDDVAFILIDYKGGGLAGAFSNKITGIELPHLVGTITNLDKAEMDRTLVSIDSEVKRRQAAFNEARDLLGESTIDIYKYQKFYKEGRLKDPIPHLFIICDEFAELKSGQPDFMDNLISVARIGRSLGVHLILATQKPSGVVNEQIWSNTKFRVCLRVQDESDSREMLKRDDAATLKQTGRFYLQVGYDELFVLGQSAWCGAKYFPSDKIVKQVDKSVNFIDDCGTFIKSIQASSGIRVRPQGEQLPAILHDIVNVASSIGKRGRMLWLPNIPSIIILDDIEKKYNVVSVPYEVQSVIGEYDAPERQEQGVVIYNFNNTIIYGNDGGEREMLLDSIIYGSVKNHAPSEVNFYIVDYGSEFSRKFSKLPHVGGVVYESDDEKYNNLFRMIKREINYRKKLFSNYGGEYKNYLKFNKLPLKVVILNNYDSIFEANQELYDVLPELVRDSFRYGFVFILSANSINSVHSKVSQNFENIYAFKLKDDGDYSSLFGTRTVIPRNIYGRGLVSSNGIHEFQVTTISDNLNDFISSFVNKICSIYSDRAASIPVLPSFVRFSDIGSVSDLYNVPIGLNKENLNIVHYDFLSSIGTIITSNRISNIENFVKSLSFVFSKVKGSELMVLDGVGNLNLGINNYYKGDFEVIVGKLVDYFNSLIDSHSSVSGVVVLYGVSKIISKVDISKLIDVSKKYENFGIVIVDDYIKIKKNVFDSWFTSIFNVNNGIWIGRGISDQNLLHLSNVTRDMTKNYGNDLGYSIVDGSDLLVKFIDFISTGDKDEE